GPGGIEANCFELVLLIEPKSAQQQFAVWVAGCGPDVGPRMHVGNFDLIDLQSRVAIRKKTEIQISNYDRFRIRDDCQVDVPEFEALRERAWQARLFVRRGSGARPCLGRIDHYREIANLKVRQHFGGSMNNQIRKAVVDMGKAEGN